VDGGSFWLVHAFALVGSNAAPAPYAALYSPWLGALLVFGMDESAATLTTVGLEFASDAVESAADPMALAEALMASIRQGAAAFDAKAGAPEASEIEKSARSTLTARAKKYASTLRGAYDDSRTGRAVETTLLNLTEGDFLGPLSLLEGTDERWLASLTPVWFYSRSGTVVVLGSSYAPLDMIWIEFDDVASASISSVSLIRLFDRVVTREGGDT
jgi:hypothetical protein